jgi:hypothetical protein
MDLAEAAAEGLGGADGAEERVAGEGRAGKARDQGRSYSVGPGSIDTDASGPKPVHKQLRGKMILVNTVN